MAPDHPDTPYPQLTLKSVEGIRRMERPPLKHAYSAPYGPPPRLTLDRRWIRGSDTESTGSSFVSKYRSRSNSTTPVPTSPFTGSAHSPSYSTDIPISRPASRKQSITGSILPAMERTESMSRALLSRSKGLLRRDSSKSTLTSLRTLDWVEQSYEQDQVQELAGWQSLHHGRTKSLGTGLDSRPMISEPFNFQHLTHTGRHQFQELDSTSDNELVTEFSAIRASQRPCREIRGIKTQNIYFKNFSSEALAREPQIQGSRSPASPQVLSPARSRDQLADMNSAGDPFTHSRPFFENFSHPSPRSIRSPTSTSSVTPPISPPLRVSSRAARTSSINSPLSPRRSPAIAELPTRRQDSSTDQSTMMGGPSSPQEDLPDIEAHPSSSIGHAVTTPDDTALVLLTPTKTLKTELPGVPEEEETSSPKRSSAQIIRQAANSPELRHAKSFPSLSIIGSAPQTFLRFSLESQEISHMVSQTSTDPTLPHVTGSHEDIMAQNDTFCKAPSGPSILDDNWEDDIDWCYQNAAEADCNFRWERRSRLEESPVVLGKKNSHTDEFTVKRFSNQPNTISIGTESRVHKSIPDKSAEGSLPIFPLPASPSTPMVKRADLASFFSGSAESSSTSIPQVNTDITTTVPPPVNLSASSTSDLQNLASGTTANIKANFESQNLRDVVYQDMLDDTADNIDDRYYAFYSHGVDGSNDNSPRNSDSSISPVDSRGSNVWSRATSLVQHSSASSLPGLIWSSKSSRETLNTAVSQQAESVEDAKGAEVSLESRAHSSPPHKRNQSLAKEVAHQSLIKKAASHSDFQETVVPSATTSPLARERANSDAAAQILNIKSATPRRPAISRARSSSVLGGGSKASYTLFPSIAVKGSF